jgi:DNA-binding transcriptional LysR family regulator
VPRQPDVTLTQLRYFVKAATYGSMTKAADELRIAQSAVSAAVSQLEHQIGTQLFIRQRARGIQDLVEVLEQGPRVSQHLLTRGGENEPASGQAGQIRGRIRIACFVTLTPFILPRLISELGSNHPDLEVEVVETQADDVRAVLRNGTAEVALTYDLGLGPGIDTEVLHIARPYVALARDHPLAASAELDLADLAAEPMVLLDLPDSRDYFEKILVDAGVKPRIHYRSASYETVRGMVARGHGFSILNQEPAHHGTYDGGEVVAVPIRGDAPGLPIVIARAHVVRVTARARAIEEAARTIFATDGSR